jgi:hypothetical protein
MKHIVQIVEELASSIHLASVLVICLRVRLTSTIRSAKITKIMEVLSQTESSTAVGDMRWLQGITGWSSYKIGRLCRINQIKGAFQSQPRTRGSMWCFKKAKTLAWLESLENK